MKDNLKEKLSKLTKEEIQNIWNTGLIYDKVRLDLEQEDNELGTFQAPYGSLIITPEQIDKLKEQGIDILLLTEKLRNEREENL